MDVSHHKGRCEVVKSEKVKASRDMRETVKSLMAKFCNRHTLILISLGQVISLCFCGTSVTSVMLQRQKVNVPLFQTFCMYYLMTMIFTTIVALRPGERNLLSVLRRCGWKYFLFAIADVEANFFVVSAYKYTTMTSQQIIGSFVMPTVMLLSFIFLKTRYKTVNYIGAVLCFVGVICVVISDVVIAGKTDSYARNEALGDVLSLAAVLCYGIQNVMIEHMLATCDIIEYIGAFSMCSLAINSIQMFILEKEQISQIPFDFIYVLMPLILFTLCLSVGYILVPILVARTSATWFALNNLTVNFYVTVIGIFVFKYNLNYLYFVSFTLVIIGILVYSVKPPELKIESQDGTSSGDAEHISERTSILRTNSSPVR